ncbi:alpha/beta hydrolase fold domain-containing protein [Mycobacterium sp. 94-17]|uniref:alpha/beta hydrolase fold domain-containing protein n=1 Tax=Mycobacterium sp. 94-17 TaxID=2986147 RepID=UPI003B63A9CC
MTKSDVDPALRRPLLPHSYHLDRGLRPQRALMKLAGLARRPQGVEVATVNPYVTVRIHRPATLREDAPAMLWVHGGGYVVGTARLDELFCRRLAHHVDAVVVAVEYRLAPDYPYPVPLEDCYAALTWLARQPWVDPSRIALGGASAGGGLAAALAILARDRGEVAPVLQMLVYPMLDDRTGSRPDRLNGRLIWNGADNQRAWGWYLGDADRSVAVPARATDLSGLAPAWLGAATLDLFYEENVAYGRALHEAGTPCHLEVVERAYHGFDMAAPDAPVSIAFFASECRHLRAALGTERRAAAQAI